MRWLLVTVSCLGLLGLAWLWWQQPSPSRPALRPVVLDDPALPATTGTGTWSDQVGLELSPGCCQELTVPKGAILGSTMVSLAWQHQGGPRSELLWLELCLLTADQRFFASAGNWHLDLQQGQGRIDIPFLPEHWAGRHGALGRDALDGVRRIWVRVFGQTTTCGRLTGRLSLLSQPQAAATQAITWEWAAPGLVDRGPWRELWFRLSQEPAAGRLLAELPDGRRLPGFREQPGIIEGGRWLARGPQRQVLRLGAEEVIPSGWRLIWVQGDQVIWKSSPLLAPAAGLIRPQPLPQAPEGLLAIPLTPPWTGQVVRLLPGQPGLRLDRHTLPAALGPFLSWQEAWTGFRGPLAISHPQAALFDQALVGGRTAIDLLPQSLFDEQGAFRFGLSPWHRDQGGPWTWPEEAFNDDRALEQLFHHMQEVVARARAAPCLEAWHLGVRETANDEEQRQRLTAFNHRLAAWLGRHDRRPLLVAQPQAATWRWPATPLWQDFSRGLGGWHARFDPLDPQPVRLRHLLVGGAGNPLNQKDRACLALPIPAGRPVGTPVGALCEVDADWSDLDRLEFDCAFRGQGAVQLFAWLTDDGHRWFQQRLSYLPGGRPWRMVIVDLSAQAVWQGVGHDHPWDGTVRRRVRRFGIMACRHLPQDGAQTTVSAQTASVAARSQPGDDDLLLIDNLRRRGWPVVPERQLAVTNLTVSPATVACHATLAADFDLSIDPDNPYDPEQADVIGEVQSPGGQTIRHPAFWSEAPRIASAGQNAPAGHWSWRFAPFEPGRWRWRLSAAITYEDRSFACTSPWRDLDVPPAVAGALLPVRRSADARWWETSDGRWFYPLGLNLRSPGDTRQDPLLTNAGLKQRSADWEAQGQACYQRWFARMHEQGMNYARVWMCPWWCGLEWTRDWPGFNGLGWYNQESAACLDRLLELAQANGIYLQVELQNHGMVSPRVDRQWDDNPYNAANGGPCPGAADFFRSEAAAKLLAKRLRYVVARWGHHPHLMAWVLSSEMEFTGAWFGVPEDPNSAYQRGYNDEQAHDPVTAAWIRRQRQQLDALDYRHRPISIHFSHPWRARLVWTDPDLGLGFNNSNVYTGFLDMGKLGGVPNGSLTGDQRGLGTALMHYLAQHFPPWEPATARPTMIGEWGGHWEESDPGKLAAELHTGLWMQSVLPFGGNVGFWWWLWVDAADKWSEYRNVARFIAGEDPRGRNYRPYGPLRLGTQTTVGHLVGMVGRGAFRLYAFTPGLDRDPNRAGLGDAGLARLDTNDPLSRWHLERWDCAQGQRIAQQMLQADAQGLLLLPVGQLKPDAAFKLDRLEASR